MASPREEEEDRVAASPTEHDEEAEAKAEEAPSTRLDNTSTRIDSNRPPSRRDTSGTTSQHSKPISAKLKQLWSKTGITVPVAQQMFKGALAPTIVIAAYQSDAWAAQYSTLGYLIGIMTILSLVIAPRAKFIQTMLMQIFLVSLAAALAVLACYCIVRARVDSEPSSNTSSSAGGPGTSGTASRGAKTSTYNSSASAVAGVWLFVMIYGISVFRAYYPQYTIPSIEFAILANVAMTYAPQFGAMAEAEAFVLALWSAMMTGFAVATGVSLFVFPLTSRHVVFEDMKGWIGNLRGALGANLGFLHSLEEVDMFAAQKTMTNGVKPERSPEAEAVLVNMRKVAASHAKCAADLTFAVREVAFGNLGPDDLKRINKLLQNISVPMIGLSSLSEIFERVSQARGWDRNQRYPDPSSPNAPDGVDPIRLQAINEWHELSKALRRQFAGLTEVVDQGLEHVSLTLRLTKKSRADRKQDEEEEEEEGKNDVPKPGDTNFAQYLDRRAEEFLESKKTILHTWCHVHGVDLPEGYFANPGACNIRLPEYMKDDDDSPEHTRLQTQLMIVLYVEFLLWTLARRTYDLVEHADHLRASGKLDKTRLVVPGLKRLRKWFWSLFRRQEGDSHDMTDSFNLSFGQAYVSLGQAYKKKKDPEHLPPKTAWEKFSVVFSNIGDFLGSSQSGFGVRVATATLAIAIINLLHVSQVFFTKERLFWAQIMASIGMAPSAGQSLRTLILRISGTAIAMVVAMVAYYIVDGHVPGVIVFYFLFNLPGLWVMLKKPAILPVGLIFTITLTLIDGYELQVRKLGVKRAEANGQEYYPVYELAPIRLLTVMAGLFVAWIFSVFPYPVTEHSQLRKNTANSLFLLANYYSTVDETAKMRLRGSKSEDELTEGSAMQKLAKARLKVFSKCNSLLAGIRAQTGFVKYDLPIGGAFPKAQYQAMAAKIQSTLNFMALISTASAAFANMHDHEDEDTRYEWARNLRRLMGSTNLTSQSVTTLLSLLSASLGHRQPLPPFLGAPEHYGLTEKMERLDPELLSVRHIAEPGYASFAVIQIALNHMVDDLKDVLDGVRELVGELDFSFHVVSSESPSTMDLGALARDKAVVGGGLNGNGRAKEE